MSENKINKIKRFFYYLYGEKCFKRLNYNWSNYPSRFEIIQKIIDKKNYENYLEIGCDKDMNFLKIKVKNKTGVDPVSGGNIKMTSDDFFKTNKIFFDCIFIDGLHIYEQTRRDVLNSIKFLSTDGVILIHDCLPSKIWNQIVPKIYGHWNGDVWKALVEFRTVKHLDTYTCKADHGIGIIFNRPNRNLLKLDVKDFKKLKFKDYYKHHENFMNLIDVNDIEKIFD